MQDVVVNATTHSWAKLRKQVFVECSATNRAFPPHLFPQGSGISGGKRVVEEPEAWEGLMEMVSFGNEGTIIFINSQKLWLPAQVLNNVKPSTSQHGEAPESRIQAEELLHFL